MISLDMRVDLQKLAPAWQAVQAVAPIAHIESEQDYQQATEILHHLF
ncbi:hypothetical protein [Desulfonatronum parangueonense]